MRAPLIYQRMMLLEDGCTLIYLRQDREDGDSRMSTDDGDTDTPRINAAGCLGDKRLSPHHVERRHPKHLAWVVRPCPLENLAV